MALGYRQRAFQGYRSVTHGASLFRVDPEGRGREFGPARSVVYLIALFRLTYESTKATHAHRSFPNIPPHLCQFSPGEAVPVGRGAS